MKTLSLVLTALLVALPFSFAQPSVSSTEIWGYLMAGEEKKFPTEAPLTDIAIFSAQVDEDGFLPSGPLSPPTLPGTRRYRFHLVITAPWIPALLHHLLDPSLPFRDRIISEVVRRSKPFDGIQIDFEGIRPRDGTAFLNFLAALRNRLPKGKILSVAAPARWASFRKAHPRDAYDYPFLARFTDRVIIMAYDEHYGGGKPGPIASFSWCKKIHDYARQTIPPEKLIMGIPLYGRSWQIPPTLSSSFGQAQVPEKARKWNSTPRETSRDGGSFRAREEVTVEVFYETPASVREKVHLYTRSPLRGLAFWRLGQESPELWRLIFPKEKMGRERIRGGGKKSVHDPRK